jgi:hypothetical protein
MMDSFTNRIAMSPAMSPRVRLTPGVSCEAPKLTGFGSLHPLFGSLSRPSQETVHHRIDGLTMEEKPVP